MSVPEGRDEIHYDYYFPCQQPCFSIVPAGLNFHWRCPIFPIFRKYGRWVRIVKIHFDAFLLKTAKDAKSAEKNEKYVAFLFKIVSLLQSS